MRKAKNTAYRWTTIGIHILWMAPVQIVLVTGIALGDACRSLFKKIQDGALEFDNLA